MSFEQQRAAYLNACENAIETNLAAVLRPQSVVSKAARYSLQNGGKRVRGMLVMAVCDMLEGNSEAAGAFACALEMIHAFSLIHDDLPCMDDDDLRRGKPACHIAYGEANALLAGDLLAIQAFEVLTRAKTEAALLVEAVKTLAEAAGAKGMIYGQELDLQQEGKPAKEDVLQNIQAHKTGALIRAAAQLGVIAAGQNPQQHPAVVRYAENIGLVFQIVDDILDATADQAVLGKPVGSDIQQQKTTFVTMFGLQAAREKAAQLTRQTVEMLQQAYPQKAAFLAAFAEDLSRRVF